MNEQQVTDRFRDAVAGEPPLGFDPDDVIDRAVKRTRRRRVVLAVAAATVVEAAVVWAFANTPGGTTDQVAAGGGRHLDPALVQQVSSAKPGISFEGTAFEETLSSYMRIARVPAGQSLMVADFDLSNPDGDRGTIQLKGGEQVLVEIPLDANRHHHLDNAAFADVGVPVTLTVNCQSSPQGCSKVTLKISGMTIREL